MPASHDGPPSPKDDEIKQSNFMVGKKSLIFGQEKQNYP